MARHGAWQLKQLTLKYCEFSGSSRGVREFVDNMLPAFTRKHPQYDVVAEVRRGRHPFVKGDFVRGEARVVDLKNRDAEEVAGIFDGLRSSSNRKSNRLKTRHMTRTPSIQGKWEPS
mmetsp:Transcript_3480/g.8672  ORF Transcript_3480/g.8672 Transcript_3480/m.8672 type:complete len:117 (-) Transcript_3480:123-473(-)